MLGILICLKKCVLCVCMCVLGWLAFVYMYIYVCMYYFIIGDDWWLFFFSCINVGYIGKECREKGISHFSIEKH